MSRKYKTPRTFKSPETYLLYKEGTRKGGYAPKTFTPEGSLRLAEALKRGVETNKRKALLAKEQRENYNVEKGIDSGQLK